jgi:hypothetical protein
VCRDGRSALSELEAGKSSRGCRLRKLGVSSFPHSCSCSFSPIGTQSDVFVRYRVSLFSFQ